MTKVAEMTREEKRDETAVAVIPRRDVADVWNFTPRSLDEAMRYAELIANSSLVPPQFKGKPGDVLIAVQWGQEIGLKPMQAIQNIAVVNNRPGIFGDLGKAIILGSGLLEDWSITSAEEMKSNGHRCRCVLKRKGISNPFIGEFSLEDAKRAGLAGKDNYKNYPERQVQWRAFWYAARDGFSDLLKGISGAEELNDLPPEPGNDPEPPHPQRRSELTLRPTAEMGSEPPVEEMREAMTAARDAEDGKPAPAKSKNGNGAKLEMKRAQEIYAAMPDYNRVKGDGAAAKLLKEKYGTSSLMSLTMAQADEYLGMLRDAAEMS